MSEDSLPPTDRSSPKISSIFYGDFYPVNAYYYHWTRDEYGLVVLEPTPVGVPTLGLESPLFLKWSHDRDQRDSPGLYLSGTSNLF